MCVAPRVGARIEISQTTDLLQCLSVAPRVGARIEIGISNKIDFEMKRRSPCGSAD